MSPEQALAARNLSMPSSHASAAKKLPVTCIQPPCLIDALTRREREILRLVAQGLTNAQVAAHLVITSRTVN
jgi:DNA-binding NarL/FixJ family response regulator